MTEATDRLAEARALFGRMMAAASGSADPRIGQVFEILPREDFLPPGPWHMLVAQRYVETPSADPVHLYRNALVAIDPERGINNGEPFLHAAWMGAAAPQPGETIIHIGAGGGYYTAALARLVDPGGKVFAYEIDARLAEMAQAQSRTLRERDAHPWRCGNSEAETRGHHLCQCRCGRPARPLAEGAEARWPHDLPVATSGGDRACGSRRTPAYRFCDAARRQFLVHPLQRCV